MEYIVLPAMAIAALTTISILLIVFGYKEYRLNKKIELLKCIVENGYEQFYLLVKAIFFIAKNNQ